MTPLRITRTGRDHTWAAPMTDAQRERAEPAFERSDRLWYRIGFIVCGSLVWAALIAAVLGASS